jgi:hypothetical protein
VPHEWIKFPIQVLRFLILFISLFVLLHICFLPSVLHLSSYLRLPAPRLSVGLLSCSLPCVLFYVLLLPLSFVFILISFLPIYSLKSSLYSTVLFSLLVPSFPGYLLYQGLRFLSILSSLIFLPFPSLLLLPRLSFVR